MKIQDRIKLLANRINQHHYIEYHFKKVMQEAYLKGVKDTKEKQLSLCSVSFELPSDEIFDMPEVDLKNPLEEFYYYERPAYLEDDQKQFRERLQKALNYLKGN